MNLKKLLLLPISLALSAASCAGIGPNTTYYMGTTSFHYDPSYSPYMVKINGSEVGGGGGGMNTSPVKVGLQTVTWRDAKTGELHSAKNEVVLTKDQLKDMKYLAAHLYPDDTVEITTSNNWPNQTDRGLEWLNKLKNKK